MAFLQAGPPGQFRGALLHTYEVLTLLFTYAGGILPPSALRASPKTPHIDFQAIFIARAAGSSTQSLVAYSAHQEFLGDAAAGILRCASLVEQDARPAVCRRGGLPRECAGV